mmetsp:Transcript_96882/g.250596  ORF Transcript_96882/g.250596 Transcript_96882/m.250596 type:complete len:411 (+) Transcript_96882:534-1766(+)
MLLRFLVGSARSRAGPLPTAAATPAALATECAQGNNVPPSQGDSVQCLTVPQGGAAQRRRGRSAPRVDCAARSGAGGARGREGATQPTGARSPPLAFRHLLPRAVVLAPHRVLLGGEVRGPRACDDVLGAVHGLARGAVASGVLPDLLLGLGRRLEGLHDPAGVLRVEQVLDLELDPLGVDALTLLVLLLLEVHEAAADLLDRLLAGPHGVERVADGVQQLADALHDVLRRELVGVVAHRQVLHHGADDPRGEQLAQEEVADELHVRQDPFLALHLLELHLLRIHAFRLLLAQLERVRVHGLELVLDDVQERGLEGHRLAAVGRGELGHLSLQSEDEVGVGLAVVRLGERLLHDQADDTLQLLRAAHLDLDDLLRDGSHVLGADLVQQALHAALQLRVAVLHLHHLVRVL